MTPDQLRTRERVERLIRLAAPFLNVVLAAGDRFSRMIESEDRDFHTPRTRGREGPSQPVSREDAWSPRA